MVEQLDSESLEIVLFSNCFAAVIDRQREVDEFKWSGPEGTLLFFGDIGFGTVCPMEGNNLISHCPARTCISNEQT